MEIQTKKGFSIIMLVIAIFVVAGLGAVGYTNYLIHFESG
jgi:Tfp pilus assembly protein PilE